MGMIGQGGAFVAGPRAETEPDEGRILRRTRLRLMAVSGLVTLVILLVLGGAIYVVVQSFQDNDLSQRLNERATEEVARVQALGPRAASRGPGFGREEVGIQALYVPPTGTLTVISASGDTIDNLPDRSTLAASRNGQTVSRDITVLGTPVRVLSLPVTYGGQTWVVQLLADRTEQAQLLSTLGLALLGGGLLALLASLLAGYLYAGRALIPIRASIDRRRAAFQRQREFTANASHELRTPLTVIRASVEDLKRNRRARVEDVGEALDDIDAEVKHLTALVDDLLLLARTDSGVVQVEHVPVDLSDSAAEAVSLLAPLADERRVQVLLDPLPAPLLGDPLRLRQLVTILVDNAIRHSPAGTSVVVHVRPDRDAAVLQVEDEGPGIRPEDLPRLFERFWRADNAPAGGTGLGLAIARWIVEQHQGFIGASNRTEGGARFWARLPSGEQATPTGDGGGDDLDTVAEAPEPAEVHEVPAA